MAVLSRCGCEDGSGEVTAIRFPQDSYEAGLAEWQDRFRAMPTHERGPIGVGTRVITMLRGVGVVEKIEADSVHVRIESPWGVPCPFTECYSRDDVMATT